MTERLSQLLHDEATHLAPPAPDLTSLLADGRRQRRRQRVTTGLAVAAGVVTVAGTAVTLVLSGLGGREAEPAAVDRNAIVWAYESEVHVGEVTASVPGTVLDLHHTSVGVLAVSTTESARLAGPGRLTLVRFDGTTEHLGELEPGQGPTTEPDRDYYVLAEPGDTEPAIVVRDAETGEVRDRFDLPGGQTSRPSMALDADTLYVRVQPRRMLTLDLVTGEVEPANRATYYSDATRGRVVTGDRRTFRVIDVETGEDLMTIPTDDNLIDADLSHDARFLRVVRAAERPGVRFQYQQPGTLEVYEVSTGEPVPGIDIGDADAVEGGWTLSGDVYTFTETGVVRCEIPEGECGETRLEALPQLPEPEPGSEELARIVRPAQP